MSQNRTRTLLRKENLARRPTAVEVVVSARQSLWSIMVDTGRQVLDALLEEDRERLCGAVKGKHYEGREAYRHGYDSGSVVLGGRKVGVRKPRARYKGGGGEATLPTYEALRQEDPLQDRVHEQMILGVSRPGRFPVLICRLRMGLAPSLLNLTLSETDRGAAVSTRTAT